MGSTEDDFQPLAEIDRIVHEPARLMILAHLSVVESADFLFLKRQTGLTSGNLSSHLSKLEDAGYISIKKEFVDKKPHTMLFITTDGERALNTYMENMKQVFSSLSE
jgi:DNA-binding transcriptional ArsR family regulator